jgi:hypothetical protein
MHELKLFDDNCIDSEQVVLEVFAVTEELSIDSEKVTEMVEPIETDDAESDGEVELTVGEVVSTTNEFIVKELLAFPAESVTVIVQSEYVPSLKETKVIVLLSLVAEVLLEEQEPPYVMVPASEDENV